MTNKSRNYIINIVKYLRNKAKHSALLPESWTVATARKCSMLTFTVEKSGHYKRLMVIVLQLSSTSLIAVYFRMTDR